MSGRNIFENTGKELDVPCEHELPNAVVVGELKDNFEPAFNVQGTCTKCQQYLSVSFPAQNLR